MELLHCLSGQGQVQCGTDTVTFTPGDLYVVNPSLPHCVYSDTAVLYRCLIIDNSFLRDNGIEPPVYFQPMIRDERFFELFEQLNKAYDGYGQKTAYAPLRIRQAVMGLLQILCGEYLADAPSQADSIANEIVKKTLLYIRKNLTSTISLDAVADYVGISKFHLCRTFKTVTGLSFSEYLNGVRIKEAQRLLQATKQSISEIAQQVGFKSSTHFGRVFKSIVGISPVTYRKSQPRK
jgi:AraC-like DNA-binding protein